MMFFITLWRIVTQMYLWYLNPIFIAGCHRMWHVANTFGCGQYHGTNCITQPIEGVSLIQFGIHQWYAFMFRIYFRSIVELNLAI